MAPCMHLAVAIQSSTVFDELYKRMPCTGTYYQRCGSVWEQQAYAPSF